MSFLRCAEYLHAVIQRLWARIYICVLCVHKDGTPYILGGELTEGWCCVLLEYFRNDVGARYRERRSLESSAIYVLPILRNVFFGLKSGGEVSLFKTVGSIILGIFPLTYLFI